MKRRAAFLLILCSFALTATAQRRVAPRPGVGAHVDDSPALRSTVRLVNIFASVVDAHGAPTPNLEQKDFRLFENGVEQQVRYFERETSMPLSIVLGVDASLSTRKDLPLELASARRFAQAVLRPVDGLSFYEFDDTVTRLCPFTNEMKTIDRAIGGVRPGGATALYDAIYLAAGALNRRDGRRVLVLITDGGDTSSSTNYDEALRAAQSAEAMIFSIIMVPVEASAGRDIGGEHALMQLAEDTGGRHYYAKNLAQLDQAFAQISNELRTQYRLAYYPTRMITGEDFHAIRLELTPEASAGATRRVLTRAGYYTTPIQ